MFVKSAGAPTNDYREAHLLSRLTSTRFAGSAFGLAPGTSYDFKLTSAAFAADQVFGHVRRATAYELRERVKPGKKRISHREISKS